jgi:hypothetical protein
MTSCEFGTLMMRLFMQAWSGWLDCLGGRAKGDRFTISAQQLQLDEPKLGQLFFELGDL